MRKLFFILMLSIYPITAFSQSQMDKETRNLIEAVCALRGANERTYERIRKQLSDDEAWTPMNETGSFQEGECPPYDDVPYFGLNRLLSLIAVERKQLHVHGDFLNGENESYDYSLYERSVKSGATVSYTVKGREGRQWFVIIPYDKVNNGLSASIRVKGESPVPFTKSDNGILTVYLDNPRLDILVPLTITVQGTRDQSFVLFNHNTRKR